ncbi:MAG: tripartite tricarboxylate transporter substrate binding protein [Xanthobacteraceae bacterium]|nr:tripartite tricarboxylate transporter substrate binding protein [Xanthobacteraceae bacterium]
MKYQRIGICALIAVGVISEIHAAGPSSFPTHAITLMVPYGAGGTVDSQLRALAKASEGQLGQPIIVENRASASGTLAAEVTAAAPADGYTITAINTSVLRLPFMTRTSYDPRRDFTYIIGISSLTSGLVVRADAPWKSFAEFLNDARANPGAISIGGPSGGTNPQIVMRQIAKQKGIEWTQIPYRSVAESSNALLGGHIAAVADAAGWAPYVNSGQFRLLVIFGSARTKSWPDVPSLNEFGIEVAATSDYGLAGPKGLEPQVVRTLHDAFKEGMHQPAFVSLLAALEQEPIYRDTNDYAAYVRNQIEAQRRIVDELGLKSD